MTAPMPERPSSEKLEHLDERLTEFAPGRWDADWLLPAEDGTTALATLRNALPALREAIEAAERAERNGARMPGSDPPLIPDEIDELRAALRALSAALGEPR